MKKNFGLSASEFEHLTQELQNGNNALFEHIFLTHTKDCIRYLRRHCRASQEEAYDATIIGLIEFRKRLIEGKVSYGNLRFLFTKIARQCLDKQRKKYPNTENLETASCIYNDHPAVNKDTVQLMGKAWSYMEERCVSVLKAFYYEGIALADIALRLDKNPTSIRKQKQRCLEALRLIFIKLQ